MELNIVSFEQAMKLKELGFPQDDYAYVVYNEYKQDCYYGDVNYPYQQKLCDAPFIELVVKWLREEKGIFFVPQKVGDCNYVLIGDLKYYQSFNYYEEALNVGIDKALNILVDKK